MSEPKRNHAGTLRPRVKVLAVNVPHCDFNIPHHRIQVEWFDPDANMVVWTETAMVREDCTYVSQIVASGEFEATNTYFIDEDGKRHFVMKCDPGKLGVPFGTLNVFGPGDK